LQTASKTKFSRTAAVSCLLGRITQSKLFLLLKKKGCCSCKKGICFF